MRSTPAISTAPIALLGKDLAVISSDVEDHQLLAQNAHPHIEVIVLDPDQDGITRITAALKTLHPIRRIHLVTPGRPGSLHLGNVTLSHDNLTCHASALHYWRSHLTLHAEILIYNSQFASNEAGKMLLDVLHHLTGAAIAASIPSLTPTLRRLRWEVDCATPSFTPSLAFPPSVVVACLAKSGSYPFPASVSRLDPTIRPKTPVAV